MPRRAEPSRRPGSPARTGLSGSPEFLPRAALSGRPESAPRAGLSASPERASSPEPPPLPREFYARPAADVALDLLGARLFRRTPAGLLGGTIVETEAYLGPQDRASHARSGPTPRNRVMFGPPGHAYVYFVYGMHWCLNVVTEGDGEAGAVLLRAMLPEVGVEEQRRLRGRPHDPLARLAAGPARLCAALAVDGALQGCDLTRVEALWIAARPEAPGDPARREASAARPEARAERPEVAAERPPFPVVRGVRVGVAYAGEPWASLPLRFGIAGHPALSRPFGG